MCDKITRFAVPDCECVHEYLYVSHWHFQTSIWQSILYRNLSTWFTKKIRKNIRGMCWVNQEAAWIDQELQNKVLSLQTSRQKKSFILTADKSEY